MIELRKVQKDAGDTWYTVRMQDLKPGDVFRMFEKTGEPTDGGKSWTVRGNFFLTDGGVYGVEIFAPIVPAPLKESPRVTAAVEDAKRLLEKLQSRS